MKQRRDTKQRQLVMDAVRAHCDHPSADQIYLDVRGRDGKISRGTVYRNLNYLSEDGEITHVRVPGADRYESRVALHYHLICTVCGAVIDAPVPYRAELDRIMAEESGYTISRHRTVFEGVCPACQMTRDSEPSHTL